MWSARAERVGAGLVCRWLLLAAWPLHLAFGALVAATTALAAVTEQTGIADAVAALAVQYVLGLCCSFGLHELGHLFVLSRAEGVTAITLERTLWRLSVSAHGRISGRDAVLAALAGPGICVAVGAALLLLAPQSHLHLWYLAHAVFLVPVFGDGRTVLSVTLSRRAARGVAQRKRG
ncbi:hypothetical protein [Microbacterium sp. NPDC097977]|uniref:hypothetical protein n=1 Tax=Microbacterium sp. NPDC097977 TaxID=3155686 RepID=UPI003326B257